MNSELERARAQTNLTRYRAGQRTGHYESFFVRANHPTRPLAFWIRYTIFSPHRQPEQALGELWAIYFDGERGQHVAVKKEVPFGRCTFSNDTFQVRIEEAHLAPGLLTGTAASGAHTITWDLTFRGDAAPLFFFPLRLYATRFPKAKSLVSRPLAVFDGALVVNGERVTVDRWVGSQNHNWGSQHTDHYAWGQVAGFDAHPESFLEVATARLKLGPFWTPFMTTLVLRHRGQEIALNRLRQAFRAQGSFSYFTWHFHSETDVVRVEGTIAAPRDTFVGLRYANPPGGFKYCLNSKLARCELQLTDKRPGRSAAPQTLVSPQRAAFEILTDDASHGIAVRV